MTHQQAKVAGAALLTSLRQRIAALSLDGLLIPSSDPHNSEYVANCYKCRAFVSGFDGSAGTCLVTPDRALLWTDGRYWLQARQTLYPEWAVIEDGKPGVLPIDEWIEQHLGAAARVGVDPSLVTVAQWDRWANRFKPTPAPDVVSSLMAEWSGGAQRCEGDPSIRDGLVYCRPAEFCGGSTIDKVNDIVRLVEAKWPAQPSKANGSSRCGVELVAVTALDEIAWLTNLRGSDVPFNPVFYAYAIVDVPQRHVTVFVDKRKLSSEAQAALDLCGAEVLPYDALLLADGDIRVRQAVDGRRVLVDENQVSSAVMTAMTRLGATVVRCPVSPLTSLKALKNSVERNGFRECHVRDGAALTRYLAWVTDAVSNGRDVTECTGADRLEAFRREEAHFVQLSFPTISSSGPNGAVIHYTPTPETCLRISRDALYLVDSGAQYLDGTTDVTRTICFSPPTAQEREAYTLVLKGYIAIQSCKWPKGTTGHRIDVLARHAMWQLGLNYAHGTGHGVGSFLNVHEGPQGIHTRPTATGATLDEHMVVSNEPGFYLNGSFGIRIENLEVVVPAVTKYNNGDYLTFETLTVAPLCRELIDAALLTPDEVIWVDKYHARVSATLTPLLADRGDTLALTYLERHCAPLCSALDGVE